MEGGNGVHIRWARISRDYIFLESRLDFNFLTLCGRLSYTSGQSRGMIGRAIAILSRGADFILV